MQEAGRLAGCRRWPSKRQRWRVSGARLSCVTSEPLPVPTLASLAEVLPRYGELRFDRTLAAAREDIGDRPDLADPGHTARLRRWLNEWTCRIGYPQPGETDIFTDSLAAWQASATDLLPDASQRLAELQDSQLQAVSRAYGDLYLLPAAISRAGRTRRIGPTAAAKLLYFVRPLAVTAWDKAISARTGGGHDEKAFLRHLSICHRWARDLESQARSLGVKPDEIGPYLHRPVSSVAKLIDEWLYRTITGGLRS